MYELGQEYFIFGGLDSRKYHCYIFDKTTHSAGMRQYTRTSVLGRNGDIIMSSDRVTNVVQEYDCIIIDRAEDNLRQLRSDLLALVGYQRLEDTIHKDEYYEAFFEAEFSPITDVNRTMAKFTLTFNRKPQRWMKYGEAGIELEGDTTQASGKTLYNPTPFEAKPLLTVYGAGVVRFYDLIGSTETDQTNVRVYGASESVTIIDCDLMESYYGSESLNSSVTLWNSAAERYYPVLKPGITRVSLEANGISRITIVPRLYMM